MSFNLKKFLSQPWPDQEKNIKIRQSLNELHLKTLCDWLLTPPIHQDLYSMYNYNAMTQLPTKITIKATIYQNNISQKPPYEFLGKIHDTNSKQTSSQPQICRIVFFNQTGWARFMRPGVTLYIAATCVWDHYRHLWSLDHPVWISKTPPLSENGFLNRIYSSTKTISPHLIKTTMDEALITLRKNSHNLKDWWPQQFLDSKKWPCWWHAIETIHMTQTDTQEYKNAYRRLAFDERVSHMIAVQNLQNQHKIHPAPTLVLKQTASVRAQLLDNLPYKLTKQQENIAQDISLLLTKNYSTQTLLQGDVGSGKTVLVFLAMLQAYDAGFQAVFLVPTEILARQHTEKLKQYLSFADISVAMVLGGFKNKTAKKILHDIEQGDVRLIIGTHAVLQESVLFKNVGFIAIDEQHRFGVLQRGFGVHQHQKTDTIPQDKQESDHDLIQNPQLLHRRPSTQNKEVLQGCSNNIDISNANMSHGHDNTTEITTFSTTHMISKQSQQEDACTPPLSQEPQQVKPHYHCLFVSATPIPRSLQISLWGAMPVFHLTEKPKNRQYIETSMLCEEEMEILWIIINRHLANKGRIYWVCPAIGELEESEKEEKAVVLRNVIERFELLNNRYPQKITMMHGQQKTVIQQEAMTQFISGATPIMIATTVIEVGVDVPEATLMIIDQSQRFGLSQLHQLRGRVGRSDLKSECVLLHGKKISPVSWTRLKVLVDTNDGFFISKRDLELRGSGDTVGTQQSGQKTYHFDDPSLDTDVAVDAIKNTADMIMSMKNPDKYQYLQELFFGKNYNVVWKAG